MVMQRLKFNRNGEVKPPNNFMKRPDSKVAESTTKKNKPEKVKKSFHPVKDEVKENAFLNARRKRITT